MSAAASPSRANTSSGRRSNMSARASCLFPATPNHRTGVRLFVERSRSQNGRVRIAGAIALVTGASSGVGRATSHALAERGATLLLHGRDRSALDEVARRTGGTVLVEDLAAPGAARRLAERTGPVDV